MFLESISRVNTIKELDPKTDPLGDLAFQAY